MSTDYNASSIKVLTPTEAEGQFSWLYIENLSAKYKRDKEWIALGLEACIHAGVSQDYFVEYYLKEDKAVKYIPEVTEIYRRLKEIKEKEAIN